MGRSSNSSDYQLSANRLISRVHVQAAYHGSTACYPNGYIEVECLGWNGAKIHCKGRVFELNKGDTYMSENPEADIMLDVQDTRVMIAWPDVPRRLSWDSDDDISPTRRPGLDLLASSPPVIPRSPVSQSPIRQPVFTAAPALPPPSGPVHIFEDGEAQEGDNALIPTSPMPADETFIRPSLSYSKSVDAHGANVKSSMMSSFSADDFSDGDEENDPVVHSFGPFGDNLLPRLASFSTTTPTQSGILGHRRIQRTTLTSCSPRKSSSFDSFRFKESPIKNHVINQLAFSRIHSQPLSAIHRNLPAELRMCVSKTMDRVSEDSEVSTPVPQLSKQDLKKLLDDIPCIGEIPRSGKDAAGQPLENEFYYVPEMDTDQMRQETVTGGMRGTGLRSVRKQHKVRMMHVVCMPPILTHCSNTTGRSHVFERLFGSFLHDYDRRTVQAVL